MSTTSLFTGSEEESLIPSAALVAKGYMVWTVSAGRRSPPPAEGMDFNTIAMAAVAEALASVAPHLPRNHFVNFEGLGLQFIVDAKGVRVEAADEDSAADPLAA